MSDKFLAKAAVTLFTVYSLGVKRSVSYSLTVVTLNLTIALNLNFNSNSSLDRNPNSELKTYPQSLIRDHKVKQFSAAEAEQVRR